MSYGLVPPTDPFTTIGPRSLDDASRALYERAVQDPSSLTESDRREVLERPPQHEEDALCQRQVGLTYNGIVEKALNNAANLSFQECDILTGGVQSRSLETVDKDLLRRGLPPDQRQLVENAQAAVTTDRERLAAKAATPVQSRLMEKMTAARGMIDSDDRRNITKANRLPWLERVLSISAPPAWGFAMIRSDFSNDNRWKEYRDAVDQAVNAALISKASAGRMESAQAKFLMLYTDDSSAVRDEGTESLQSLRQKFADLKSSPEWTPGLRHDVFLYADSAALESIGTDRPFCWAVEAEPDADDPTEPEAQALKVALIQVAPTLYARLLQKELPDPRDPRRSRWTPYKGPPTLRNLRSQVGESRDGVWPPPHQFN